MPSVMDAVVGSPMGPGLTAGATHAEAWKERPQLPGAIEENVDLSFKATDHSSAHKLLYGGKKSVSFGISLDTVVTYILDEDLNTDDTSSGDSESDDVCPSEVGLGAPWKSVDAPAIVWEIVGTTTTEDREKLGGTAHLPDVLASEVGNFEKACGDFSPESSPYLDAGASFAAAAAGGGALYGQEASAPRRFSHRRTRSCSWQA
uniref:Uncharacterized protein n=1 Tax=Alexandrium monilatum TaxID=311494 RepID=A0A7S4QEQ9_9DINO|mmetsp:Transcript_71761/g.214285  ORF Transcript_71761/g.214285 Transcript_71761/m.214285 type:complete len:204 (+) Transcript_71761:50-661(+)